MRRYDKGAKVYGVAPVAFVLEPVPPSFRGASDEEAFVLLGDAGDASLAATASVAAPAVEDAELPASPAVSAGFSVVATASLGGSTRSSSVGSIFNHFFRRSSG